MPPTSASAQIVVNARTSMKFAPGEESHCANSAIDSNY
jgi:hypothetical protein